MSINFGYGGMNMMNGMSQGSSGNVFQEMKAKYGCEHCFQQNPIPYNYPMYVNPRPRNVTNPTFFSKILKLFTGG